MKILLNSLPGSLYFHYTLNKSSEDNKFLKEGKPLKMRKFFTLFICSMLVLSCSNDLFAKNKKKMTPQQVYQDTLNKLENIEQAMPYEQGLIFKLRANLNELYSHTINNETDPVGPDGKLLYPDLNKSGDLYAGCYDLKNEDLKNKLLSLIDNHVSIGYQRAQDVIFMELDNFDGWVTCVYTGRKLKTDCEPPASNMNVEHTWPQSQGAKPPIPRSDLHHLFPSDSKANSRRSNHPFGYVTKPKWQEGGSKTSGKVFEVRPEQRGNTARAKFYFAVRYNKSIPANEEKVLREWAKQDPVDEFETNRNNKIQNYQHNRNPFVDHPEFIDQIADF